MLDISTKTILKFFLVAGIIFFVYLISDVILILFVSVIIASAVDPAASWMMKLKIPRPVAVLAIYLAVISIAALVFYLIIPIILAEANQLSSQIPSYYNSFREALSKVKISFEERFFQNIKDFSFNISDQIQRLTSDIFPTFFSLFKGAFKAVIVFVISFYLAVQERGVEKFLRLVFPVTQEDYAVDLWRRAEKKLSQWLYGQFLLGAVVGYLVFVGLNIIGVKYALILAIMAGLLEIIPVAGPVISALIGTAIALFQSPFMALITIIFYTAIQQIENNLVMPIVMNKVTGLNPAVVMIALLVGAKLGGIIGMVISVPFVSILAEALDDYDKTKKLELKIKN